MCDTCRVSARQEIRRVNATSIAYERYRSRQLIGLDDDGIKSYDQSRNAPC